MKRSSSTLNQAQEDHDTREEIMDLLKPMRSQFSRSKQFWYSRALPIGIGVYLAAVVVAWPLPRWLTGLLALGTVLAQIAAFVFRQAALSCYVEAESVRRRIMLQDGLGIAPSPSIFAPLHERSAGMATTEAKLDRTFYDSDEAQGSRRLLDIIAEAAFFTSSLARRTWKAFAATAIIGLAAPLILLLLATILGTAESVLEVGARAVIASMAFWVVGDIAAMAIQFFQLSLNAEQMLDQCERLLRQSNLETTDVLLLYAEYNCAVVRTPPIPFWIYTSCRDRLNEAWNERKRVLQGGQKED
jgi:hypothetical protein